MASTATQSISTATLMRSLARLLHRDKDINGDVEQRRDDAADEQDLSCHAAPHYAAAVLICLGLAVRGAPVRRMPFSRFAVTLSTAMGFVTLKHR